MSNFWLYVFILSIDAIFMMITTYLSSLTKHLEWPSFFKGGIGALIGLLVEVGRNLAAFGLANYAANPIGDFLDGLIRFSIVKIPILVGIGFTVASAAKYTKVSKICPKCNNEFKYDPTKIEGYLIPQADGKGFEVAKEYKVDCPNCKTILVIESKESELVSYKPEGENEVIMADRYKKQEISIIKDAAINFEERKPLIFEERFKKKANLLIANLSSEREKGLITNEEYLQKEKEIVEKCRSELVQQDSKISYEVYRKLASTKQATVERLLETINKDELIILHHNKVKILNNSEWNNIVNGGTAGNSEIIFKSD